MAKRRQSKQNQKPQTPKPAPAEPVFDEPVFDEPVFDEEPTYTAPPTTEDEPDWDNRQTSALSSYGATLDDEPVFHAETAPRSSRVAVAPTPESDADASAPGADDAAAYVWPGQGSLAAPRSRGRRLGRTGPFWYIAAGALVIMVALMWFFWPGGDEDTLADTELATPLPGIAGSTTLPLEVEIVEPTVEVLPTATPVPVISVNQRVVVGNTAGQGIRLRSEPGTNGQTLAIYNDGDPFVVLEPDGSDVPYPVEADGYRWYRIQVVDNPNENLTGWAAGDFLIPTE